MSDKKTYKGSKNALVLTGGGARAAYQVGVLSAIAKFVPRNHGIPFPYCVVPLLVRLIPQHLPVMPLAFI